MLQLQVESNYQPGHIAQAYGHGMTVIGSAQPAQVREGDLRVLLTVNGEWDFEIECLDASVESEIAGRYCNDPSTITPEIEAAIDGKCDGEEFEYNGVQHRYVCRSNNWFEYFIDVYRDGTWREYAFEVAEYDKGPAPDEMLKGMEDYLDSVLDEAA